MPARAPSSSPKKPGLFDSEMWLSLARSGSSHRRRRWVPCRPWRRRRSQGLLSAPLFLTASRGFYGCDGARVLILLASCFGSLFSLSCLCQLSVGETPVSASYYLLPRWCGACIVTCRQLQRVLQPLKAQLESIRGLPKAAFSCSALSGTREAHTATTHRIWFGALGSGKRSSHEDNWHGLQLGASNVTIP